jgi:hypothetical protein
MMTTLASTRPSAVLIVDGPLASLASSSRIEMLKPPKGFDGGGVEDGGVEPLVRSVMSAS